MQERWIKARGLGWDDSHAHRSAEEMYERMFFMKFLPPGRGLWAMGTDITEKRGLYAALNNCAFVSTADMHMDPVKPFTFLMDASMLGVGVGFDTLGAGSIIIRKPIPFRGKVHIVKDSREGWVEALEVLLNQYFFGAETVLFNYDEVRPYGTAIKGFGGVASGPEPLQNLFIKIATILNKQVAYLISVTNIVDIMNLIGCCVIAGNVRRTAEIAFGQSDSDEFLNLKNYEMNPDRAEYGWASNNSIFCQLGMDYQHVCKTVQTNGEPGFAWLDNMKDFSRMNCEEGDNKDERAQGGNPCLEQTLESFELCCLVETFPNHHDDMYDFHRTLKFAYLYAKTVTLGETHWPETNRVLLRNRRIGCSVTGIAQFLAKWDMESLKYWLTEGYNTLERYDKIYSDWLCIPRSIKMTSVKPSGTVSLVAGATPGMHYPESQYYIRRVRLAGSSPLLKQLQVNGYYTEKSKTDSSTMIVEFPIYAGDGVRTINEVTMWEQLALAAFLQKYWADNQVSCTVTFTPEEGKHIHNALNYYQYQLKGISFLPKSTGAYEQMPYEAITKQVYDVMVHMIDEKKSLCNIPLDPEDQQRESFCDGETCGVINPGSQPQ
jgi:adenosylcobalamin-dependent ribonucleoside-triphosphate reductase